MLPELYHAHHSRQMEDLPFWLNLAARQESPVLELGCGTGRVLVPLARAGYTVIGIDHDPGMLRYLKSKFQPVSGSGPLLILADISKFSLGRQFPLVIVPCNTLSTLGHTSRKDCLSCVRRHLQPGGLFAASLPDPALIASHPARAGIELEDEFLHPTTGNPVQVSSDWRLSGNKFTVTWLYDHLFPDGRVERYKLEASHYLVSLDELLAEVQAAGMRIREMYGDFDCSAYAPGAPQLILLAEAVY